MPLDSVAWHIVFSLDDGAGGRMFQKSKWSGERVVVVRISTLLRICDLVMLGPSHECC